MKSKKYSSKMLLSKLSLGGMLVFICLSPSDMLAAKPQPPPNAPPQIVSIAPSSGTVLVNAATNFTSLYSDADGWQNLSKAQLLINTSTSGAKCFDAYYDQNSNKFYLREDSDKKWLGGYAPESANTIQNSYATLDCSKSSIVGSGTTLSVTWSITFKSTFTGKKNLYLYVTDDKGASQGWVNKGTCSIIQDTTPPTGTITINNGARYTNAASVTLTLSAKDNTGGSGVSQMQFSNDNKTWSTPETYATTKTWTLKSGDGTKTVYVKYKDVAGNWSSPISSTIILDTSVPATTISGVDGLWHNKSVTVTLSASDTGSGIDKTYYSTDGTNPTLIYTAPFRLTNDGIYSIKYYSLDKAGNAEVIKTSANQVKIDTMAPSGSIQINNAAQYVNSTSVILALNAVDSGSGLNQMQFSNDGTTWSTPEAYATTKNWTLVSGDGTKTVYVKFKDVAGNWSVSYSATIILDTTPSDTTPPTGTIKINSGAPYTNSISVTLALSAQDNPGGSGVSQMQFSNDNTTWSTPEVYATAKAWTLSSGDDTKTVYVKFKDVAGNWSVSYSATIILDTTPPQINITSPSDNQVIEAK